MTKNKLPPIEVQQLRRIVEAYGEGAVDDALMEIGGYKSGDCYADWQKYIDKKVLEAAKTIGAYIK